MSQGQTPELKTRQTRDPLRQKNELRGRPIPPLEKAGQALRKTSVTRVTRADGQERAKTPVDRQDPSSLHDVRQTGKGAEAPSQTFSLNP
jgi:hypothetical protein